MPSVRGEGAGEEQRTSEVVLEHGGELDPPMTEAAAVGFEQREKDANDRCRLRFEPHQFFNNRCSISGRAASTTSPTI